MSKNIKCLITAGCSYSQVPNRDTAWPFHLNERLKPEKVYYLGQCAAGNGIISRKVIHALNEALETYKPEEILVGILWSGYDRREVYSTKNLDSTIFHYGEEVYCNPLKVVDRSDYYIINTHWTDNLTVNFLKHAYIPEDSLMITLEHILRIQWYLKLQNIKYFMSEYDYDCLDTAPVPYGKGLIKNNKDLLLLYRQIDKKNWLPINNLYEWAKEESGFDFARPPDPHPSTEQHKAFTDRVIIPFLLDKKMVHDILT